MSLETQFEEAKKIINEAVNENKDILSYDDFKLEILKLSRDLLSLITLNDVRGLVWLKNTRWAKGNLDVAIDRLIKDIKKSKK